MLEMSRYQFPTSWLDVDNVEGEWGEGVGFNEILKRKIPPCKARSTCSFRSQYYYSRLTLLWKQSNSKLITVYTITGIMHIVCLVLSHN